MEVRLTGTLLSQVFFHHHEASQPGRSAGCMEFDTSFLSGMDLMISSRNCKAR